MTRGALGDSLPAGAYAAEIDSAIFRDPLGIAVTEIASRHVLIGILTGAEETDR